MKDPQLNMGQEEELRPYREPPGQHGPPGDRDNKEPGV